jgi:flavin-dependent dehydrogenase
MPVRATKRGVERTPLSGDYDVLIGGASFAGLAVARELRATGARVLVLDRYEIGERQTSACAAPTAWLENLGLADSIRQRFDSVVVHTPGTTARWPLPWGFSTFDYPALCELLWEQRGPGTEFETAVVTRNVAGSNAAGVADGETVLTGAQVHTVHTDRGEVRAPLVVDALGWRRVLGSGDTLQPPEALLSRGLEVHPTGHSPDLELWIDKGYVRAGYGWSFPAGDEVRIGVGSFDPRDHVKEPTVRLTADLEAEPLGYQGNWIPHALRPATQDGIFFAGDSAGHCLPLTAEGIRTALYFGVACGRELAAVVEGERSREDALRRYHAFSAGHAWKFAWLKRWQDNIWRVRPRPRDALTRSLRSPGFAAWAFGHYLRVAPPEFALPAPPPALAPARARSAQLAA